MRCLISIFVCLLTVSACQGRTITVDDDGPADFNNIQAAINDANNGDIVMVLPGTYTGTGNRDIDFGGKAITVQSADPCDPTIVAATTINCGGTEAEPHRGFHFHSGEDANSVLTGLTITNGYADEGGGISCDESSSPTVSNCIITDNSAEFKGGGIYCFASEVTISNCRIIGNHANDGGGICNYCWESPTISNCIIRNNNADYYGGGVCSYCWSSGLTMNNCTIIGNNADYGNGVYCGWLTSVTVSNCILRSDESGDEITLEDGNLTISYSDVQGGRGSGINIDSNSTLNWGEGNIYANPLFVTGPLGDYYLSQTPGGRNSPCVDAGSDTAENLGMDIFTTRRIDQAGDEGIVDMGYHYPVTTANPADISEDLYVDMVDFAILAWQWLETPGVPSADIAPYSGDEFVDNLDLAALLESWLACYVMPATNPRPYNNAVTVDPNLTIFWSAGNSYHDVYFGSDANAVANADHLSAEFMGTFSDANFAPNTLDLNSSYYWRTDEVGPRCMQTGQVWSFTTAPSWPWPECWYWPYQCHGDADGKMFLGRRVTTLDRNIFDAAYPSRYPEPNYNPCADFDRDGYVSADDNDIITFWFNKLDVPNDCPSGGQWPPFF